MKLRLDECVVRDKYAKSHFCFYIPLFAEEKFLSCFADFSEFLFCANALKCLIACDVVLGKVAEPSINSTSLHPGWRSAQTCVSCLVGVYEDPDNSLNTFKEQERLRAKAIAFAAKLRTFGYGEYINEGDSYNPNWKLDYWGERYVDLLRLKVIYDPDNFFSCHHCVGSDYGSFRDAFGISGSDTVTKTSVYIFLLSVILVLIFS